jgi:hypothetical protein
MLACADIEEGSRDAGVMQRLDLRALGVSDLAGV